MKNLIDDLIHCCPPQAFHLVLSLACTGSFKPLCSTWLHNSEHATWRGHHLSTFRLSEQGAEGTADAQEPRLQAPPGDQRGSWRQLQQEEAEYESHLLSLQAAAEGWASHSLASPTKNKLYFALSDLFVFFCSEGSYLGCLAVSGHTRVLSAHRQQDFMKVTYLGISLWLCFLTWGQGWVI